MIEEREQLKACCNESMRKRIEFAEMNKLTKRQIRDDLREHKMNLIKNIMEDSKSIRKIKKEVSNGKNWMLGVKDSRGNRIAARQNIIDHATEF